MVLGDRIRECLLRLPASQADLARAIGVTPQAVSKMIRGGTTDTSKLHLIARFLKTTPEYLTGESDDRDQSYILSDRQSGFRGLAPERDPDHVEVQELDLTFGMGGGAFMDDIPVKTEARTFSRAWLRNFTSSPVEKLYFARGMGDSMMPTIHDQDVVLIDTMQDTPRMADQIWAVSFCGLGMVKRLRPARDGGMLIMSDNPVVQDDMAHDGELQVLGRVVAIMRRV